MIDIKSNLTIIDNYFNNPCKEGSILVEIPPCRRTIFFDKTSYFLSFPKILFFMRYIRHYALLTGVPGYVINFIRMAFTEGTEKILLVPPLPNISGYSLDICLSKLCQGETLEEMAKNQIANIFNPEWIPSNFKIFDAKTLFYSFTQN